MSTPDLEKGNAAHRDNEKAAVHHHNHANGTRAPAPAPAPGPAASRISNPGPLGLFSFASTTFILSMFNVSVRNVAHANAVVGMAVFCGGLAQLLAGMWEFPRGNTFAATAFSSYGAFWMSYATILIPGSGIISAYTNPTTGELNESEFASAVGIFLIAWMLVTFYFLIAALRKNVSFIVLFSFLTVTFLLLAAGEFAASTGAHKAGGYMGILTAFVAYYIGLSELLASEQAAVVRIPIGVFKHD